MKRILTLILVLALALAALTSCAVVDTVKGWFGGEEHEHSFVEGKCECGEVDPDYKPEPPAPEVDEDLQLAYDFVKETYKNLSATPSNFEIVKNAPIGEKIFPITWTTSLPEQITITETEDGNFYVVNVPDLPEEAINYTLNFSVQNEAGEKKEGSFNLTVPQYRVSSHEEYVNAEDGTPLVIQGIVTGIYSKSTNSDKENSLVLQDVNGNGGYYAYNLADDPAGSISVGMTVEVKGYKKNHYGTHELTSPSVKVVDASIKSATALDFTQAVIAAASLDAAELVNKSGTLVTLTGVTLLEYNEGNGYHNFQIGNHKAYLRVSSSSNMITKAEGETVTETFNANFYNKADVTGVITIYNNAIYLMPVSSAPFTNITEQEKPADVKIGIALDNTTIPGYIQAVGNTTLPTTFSSFSDVAIAWELVGESTVASVSNNVLAVSAIPEEAQTVTLKATATCGQISDSKEFTVIVKGIDTLTIEEVDNMVANYVKDQYTEEKFYVVGIIEQISNTTYGNMYIVAGEYGIDIYGLNDENDKKYSEFTGYKPQVGDTIKVLTVVGKYNNPQLKNAVLVEYSHNYVAVVTEPNCSAQGYTTYTCKCGDRYIADYTDKTACNYGDDDVCDTCGVKNHDHTTVATDEVVAPTCIAEGYTVYKCSDEACAFTEKKDTTEKIAHADANGDYKCDTEGCDELVLPAADSTLTIEQALAIGALFSKDSYTPNKYYVTGTIKEVYNTSYGNMYLTDGTNTITIYGTYSADGALRYDKLTGTKPAAGDVVTVYGIIGFYTAPQMKNGWIQHGYNEDVTAPDCKNEGYTTFTCKYCGYSYVGDKVPAGECSFDESGVCTGCGALNHEHVWNEGVVTDATCLEAGYTTYSCTLDNCTKTNVVAGAAALGHAYTDGVCANGCGIDDPTYYFPMTITEALAQADGKKVKVTGTVIQINTAWDSYWKNITVTIADGSGDTLYLYRLATDVKLNDIITVTGVVGSHNGAKQIAAGATATIDGTHTCSEYTEATCKDPAACVVCGTETGDLGEHNYVEGVCSVCGHEEGAAEIELITADKNISDLIASEGWTSSTTKQSFKLDDNVTVKVDGGSNSGKAYTDHIRIYATDTPAGSMTISVAEGYELVSVKVSTATGTYAFLYLGDGTTDISNVETEISGSSVVLNTAKNGDNGKQVRVTAIEVVYKAVATA